MDLDEVRAWRTATKDVVPVVVVDFEDRYGFPPGENVVEDTDKGDAEHRLQGLLKKFRIAGMSNAVQEVQWSDLQRDPKSVAELADAGDVRVRRRDGAPLILTREDRQASAGEGAFTAARALRNVLAHAPAEAVADALAEEFPWLRLLPADEIAQFALDFVRASQASAELGQWSVLAQTIREWKATAAVYADPTLVRELTKPVTDDFGSAAAPVATDEE